jgi:hypothetical protein
MARIQRVAVGRRHNRRSPLSVCSEVNHEQVSDLFNEFMTQDTGLSTSWPKIRGTASCARGSESAFCVYCHGSRSAAPFSRPETTQLCARFQPTPL